MTSLKPRHTLKNNWPTRGHPNPIFSEDALQRVFEFSSGVPRLINRACTQALIYACQNRRAIIDDRMVQIVLEGEVA